MKTMYILMLQKRVIQLYFFSEEATFFIKQNNMVHHDSTG